MTEGLDLLWQAKWKTLGSAMHYEFHRAIGNIGIFRAPDARSASVIAMNGARQEDYPPGWLVDAIDKSLGVADWQLGECDRLSVALDWLRVYDPEGADVVVALCLRGRSTTIWSRGVRHYALGEVDDVKKAQEYLRKSCCGLRMERDNPDHVSILPGG